MENSERITKALAYIRSQNQNSEISIEDVADHAGFSTNYFNRIFLAHTGFNVMEHVRFTRMKKAARLLRTTDRDVLAIALDCGYEAHEGFTRACKKQYADKTITGTLAEHGVSVAEIRRRYTHAYTGDPYAITPPQMKRVKAENSIPQIWDTDVSPAHVK